MVIQTDRYSDNIHKKNQTANPTRNAFSVKSNLVQNLKIHVYPTISNFEKSLPGQSLQGGHSLHGIPPSIVLCFASVTLWPPKWPSLNFSELCQLSNINTTPMNIHEHFGLHLNKTHDSRSTILRPTKVKYAECLQP